MSYCVTFVRRRGRSWDDALADAQEGPKNPLDREDYDRALEAVLKVLGANLDTFVGNGYYEITHRDTGIQLTRSAGAASVSLPYWHSTEDAHVLMEKFYELGIVIEAVTALEGYDRQLDLPLTEASARIDLAVECFRNLKAMIQ